jgi:hypothetical protein
MLSGRSRHPAALLSFALITLATSAHADAHPLAKDPRHGAIVSPRTFTVLPPFGMPTHPATRPRPAPAYEVVLGAALGAHGVPDALVAEANPAIANELGRNLRVQVVPPRAPRTPGRPRFVLRAQVSRLESRAGGRLRVCVRIVVRDQTTRIRDLRAGCASAGGPAAREQPGRLALGGAVRGALRDFDPRP